jgi:cobaltochelatase CobN
MLSHAAASLPEDFPRTVGLNLQRIKDNDDMTNLISRLRLDLSTTKVIVVRVLGRASGVPSFSKLVEFATANKIALLVLSGTADLDPELACLSTVEASLLQEVMLYFNAGGHKNIAQMLRLLSDRLLLSGFGYEAPSFLPEFGYYFPEGRQIDFDPNQPAIGITFYRAHWLSGNTKFVDALVQAIEDYGMQAIPVFASSLKAIKDNGEDLASAFQLFMLDGKPMIDVLIDTTSFAVSDLHSCDKGQANKMSAQEMLDVPILQAICANASLSLWRETRRGLSPLDTAMNVVMPEFDGRIIGVPVSFKEKCEEIDAFFYEPLLDRIEKMADLAAKFSRLKHLSNAEKRIAFILTNSNSKASQIGNAVGLDAPASLHDLLLQMKKSGYIIDDLPKNGTSLIHDLIDCCSYDQTILSSDQADRALGHVSLQRYQSWYDELPESLRAKISRQWGDPPGEAYLHDGRLIVSGLRLGNAVVILQPPRGYGMDPNSIYHEPDLPPTHHYYAVYKWLADDFKADAIVHVGKHGTLEWLPGKGVGLSEECFPDALLTDLPLFYPFILNDPGEGSQAKRRAHAVIIDHLMPPMTNAETYGVLAELTQLVDEYYQVELLDPTKLPLLQQQIWDLIKKSNLDKDLELIVADHHDEEHEHGEEEVHEHDPHINDHTHDHDHQWNDELTDHGVPVSLAEMDSVKFSHLLQDIDGYLCELGLAQIRNGLHVLATVPEGDVLVDMLCSLTRLANAAAPSLQGEVARLFNLDTGALLQEPGKRLQEVLPSLTKLTAKPIVTHSDALELIEELTKKIYKTLLDSQFDPDTIKSAVTSVLRYSQVPSTLEQVLKFACTEVVPNLRRTGDEIGNLMHALNGGYVPPGPSGAPTRGMAHILPTGRNFYSVDPRHLPSQSAWQVGTQLAEEVLKRHLAEEGSYPESVSISVWGTSAMRTQGDDVGQILALMGVRPLWQAENRRVSGVELVPLSELGRPRVDVTVRISGFFRDAFQHLIDLIDQAVIAAAKAEEDPQDNFVRKHFLEDVEQLKQSGSTDEIAEQMSMFRIFGAKPGSYGAGILPLINERNWQNADDFAEAYVNWGGYAYSQKEAGMEAKSVFRQRLSQTEIALHNQDNREHDIFDSDDYLQFHGGMIATIKSLSGKKPKHYFGDTHDPSRTVVRDLKQESLRVFRSRVVNPKWIESIQKHGYKGGLEVTATVDYFFGYDATAEIMEDWMYEELTQAYAFDDKMRQFLDDNNPWALHAIAERLLEAAHRKMWKNPQKETIAKLESIYLEGEAQLEARSEKSMLLEVRS